MKLSCPECGGTVFMRAVKRVSFHTPNWFDRLFRLQPQEVSEGHNAVCDSCDALLVIDATGVRPRVRRHAAQPPTPTLEAHRVERPNIDPHTTPGLAWTRQR